MRWYILGDRSSLLHHTLLRRFEAVHRRAACSFSSTTFSLEQGPVVRLGRHLKYQPSFFYTS